MLKTKGDDGEKVTKRASKRAKETVNQNKATHQSESAQAEGSEANSDTPGTSDSLDTWDEELLMGTVETNYYPNSIVSYRYILSMVFWVFDE